ncbi:MULTISPECIES: polysaccharide deacetylase family protein [unclassified Streptomyces]|uniref:polysaccharide deacetylase family protein n=1 Tax=unclassified Streptomyces TaxID=2593676 RepID=UPI002E7A1C3C|nr:polysaccharide deacetylase family protein [Streptomyces sp. JV190]MEE1841181.1 polysaccharide deacetylase family protein [Streptomyces sp. JV190]
MTGRPDRPADRALLLTFDDRHVRAWAAAAPLFTSYGARVTFFVCEPDRLDRDEVRLLRRLADDGHTIGCHGLRHERAPEFVAAHGAGAYLDREVVPALDGLRRLGFPARAFAYPCSARDENTDRLLLTLFERLRGGVPVGRRADPSLAAELHVPARELADRRVLLGCSVDSGRGTLAYADDLGGVEAALRRTAEHGGVTTLYAHCVADAHEANHVTPARLEKLLAAADGMSLPCVGFDELP